MAFGKFFDKALVPFFGGCGAAQAVDFDGIGSFAEQMQRVVCGLPSETFVVYAYAGGICVAYYVAVKCYDWYAAFVYLLYYGG